MVLTPYVLSGIAVFFARDVIGKWIQKRIEQQFDEKIERLKSELCLKEQAVSVDLMPLTKSSVSFRAAVGTGLAVQFVPPRPIGGVL